MSSNKSFQSSMPSSSTNSIHDGGDSSAATALTVIPSSLLMLPLQRSSSCGYRSIGNGLLPSLSSIASYPQGDNDYDRHAILLETIEAVLEIVNEGDFPFDDDSSNALPQYSTVHHYDQQQDNRGISSSRSINSNNSNESSEASGTASQ